MKNLFFSLAFMLMGSIAFASNGTSNLEKLNENFGSTSNIKATTCTITVSFGDSNVTITSECDDCTQTEACDTAYKIARLTAVLADMF